MNKDELHKKKIEVLDHFARGQELIDSMPEGEEKEVYQHALKMGRESVRGGDHIEAWHDTEGVSDEIYKMLNDLHSLMAFLMQTCLMVVLLDNLIDEIDPETAEEGFLVGAEQVILSAFQIGRAKGREEAKNEQG